MLTQEYLKSILDYDPLTGVFTWTIKPSKNINAGSIAGCKMKNGYIQIGINRKRYQAHRLAWLYVNGAFPKDEIDHINGIKSDNRIINLRDGAHAKNQQNQIRSQKNSNCNYLGVVYDKNRNKYMARITINNQQKYLGRFSTPESAHDAYLKAKRELHEFCTI